MSRLCDGSLGPPTHYTLQRRMQSLPLAPDAVTEWAQTQMEASPQSSCGGYAHIH